MHIRTATKTKVIAAAVSLIMTLSAGQFLLKDSVSANAQIDGGTVDNIEWHLYDDNSLVIEGTGKMPYTLVSEWGKEGRVVNVKETATSIEIGEGITSVSSGLFSGFEKVTTVSLPSTITLLDDYAFMSCKSLQSINIPASCQTIKSYVFDECKELGSIYLPDGLTKIERYCFNGCEALANVTIPDTVTSIGDHAFQNCKSFTELTIPGSVETVADYAFFGCGIKTLRLGSDSISFGDKAIALAITEFYCDGTEYDFTNNYGGQAEVDKLLKNVKEQDMHYSKCYVLFSRNSGDIFDGDAIRVAAGSKIDKNDVPFYTREGYAFTGKWYSDLDCLNEFDFDTPVTADMALLAGWASAPAGKIEGYSLVLEGDVGINFYIAKSNLPADAVVELTNIKDGKTINKAVYELSDQNIPEETVRGVDCKVVRLNVAPAMMTNPVSVTLKYGDKTEVLGTFTAREYAEVILRDADTNPEYKKAEKLVLAMLNLGAYCQKYFNVNVKDLANRGHEIDLETPSQYDQPLITGYSGTGDVPPIKYYGSSLDLNDKTKATVYFQIMQGVDYTDYEYYVDGNKVTPDLNSNINFISITLGNIDASDLNKGYTINIKGEGNVDYYYVYYASLYCCAAYNSTTTDQKLKDLACALWTYAKEATDYYGN